MLPHTLDQVYEKYGCELCLVITNINAMMSEYCHPKTTPDMSILSAVRMSISFPRTVFIFIFDFTEYFFRPVQLIVTKC